MFFFFHANAYYIHICIWGQLVYICYTLIKLDLNFVTNLMFLFTIIVNNLKNKKLYLLIEVL